jgi:hypothetical protein
MKIKSSPWGSVQHQHEIAPGIISVSTAGHGGIWLSFERQAQLPAWALQVPSSYCSKPMWWEEDCESQVIMYVFFEEIEKLHGAFPWFLSKEKLAKYIQQFGYLNFPQAA